MGQGQSPSLQIVRRGRGAYKFPQMRLLAGVFSIKPYQVRYPLSTCFPGELYFNVIVVFTEPASASSSNQREVTVLVWV